MIARPGAAYRHPWHKRNNGFVRHPKWRRVAAMTGLHLTTVIAVVDAFLEAANIGRPRGSLSELSIVECAIDLDLPEQHVADVRQALEQLGWVQADYLVTWDEHNRDREDRTNADRQQRWRDRRKAAEHDGDLSTVRNVTQRYVTPEEKRIDHRPPVEISGDGASRRAAGLSDASAGGPALDPQAAAAWLDGEGARMVSDRMIEPLAQALARIVRWRDQQLGGDGEALVAVLQAADAAGYVGARFHNLVVDGIRRAPRRESPQAPLPLPPVPVTRRVGGGG